MIIINLQDGHPPCSIILDGHGTVIMAPNPVGFFLDWKKEHVLAYAAYRGWEIKEAEDES